MKSTHQKSLYTLMRTSILASLVVLMTACSETVAPISDSATVTDDLKIEQYSLNAPSTLGSAGQPIETTFSATLVRFEPESQTVLPSGTVINEFATFWESMGDWEGTFVGDNSNIIHKNGVVTGQAFFTFEGAVLGFEGTLQIRFQATTKADGTFKARFAILSGTGELANLRGHGTNVIVGPGEIEGTVFVHSAP
jgi:hypothetical protein